MKKKKTDTNQSALHKSNKSLSQNIGIGYIFQLDGKFNSVLLPEWRIMQQTAFELFMPYQHKVKKEIHDNNAEQNACGPGNDRRKQICGVRKKAV